MLQSQKALRTNHTACFGLLLTVVGGQRSSLSGAHAYGINHSSFAKIAMPSISCRHTCAVTGNATPQGSIYIVSPVDGRTKGTSTYTQKLWRGKYCYLYPTHMEKRVLYRPDGQLARSRPNSRGKMFNQAGETGAGVVYSFSVVPKLESGSINMKRYSAFDVVLNPSSTHTSSPVFARLYRSPHNEAHERFGSCCSSNARSCCS